MTRPGVADSRVFVATILVVILVTLGYLVGIHVTPGKHRALVLSTEACLKAEKRAVMLCRTDGTCEVLCREHNDE